MFGFNNIQREYDKKPIENQSFFSLNAFYNSFNIFSFSLQQMDASKDARQVSGAHIDAFSWSN